MLSRLCLVLPVLAASLALSGTTLLADEAYRPPPGSNQVLSAPLALADGLEVIISDVVIPPNAAVPPHSHPGQEFVYVIEGSAMHVVEGAEQRIYRPGEAFTIEPGVVHSPYATEEGARAIVFRVHIEGEPIRVPAE